MTTATGIRLEGLVKSFATPTGTVHAVRGVDSRHRAGRDGRPARPERRRQVDPDRHAARPARARHRHRLRCSGAPPAQASTTGAVGAMLQTGGLLRDLSVRELVSMMASLYPDPLPVDEALELTGIDALRRAAAREAVRRSDAARPLRARAGRNPELLVLDEPTVALDVEGAPRVLDDDAGDFAAARQDGAVRHALPRGGRRLRRPHRRDGARSRRRRRAAHRDQGDGRASARSAPRSPAPTSTTSGAAGRQPPPSAVAPRSCCAAPTRIGASARCSTRYPDGARHRDQRRRARGGLPRAHCRRRPRGGRAR